MTLSRILTATAVTGAMALAACTPANLASVENNPNTTGGAVTGAAIGGLIAGPITGGSGGRTAAGAVAGAIIGGAIGQRLDQQARELDSALGNNITVENQGDKLLVSFPQDILFAVNSTSISAGSRNDLNALAANLNRYPDTNVEIIGHTDNTGDAGYNFDLSTRRAGAVSAVLVNDGVAGNRITATGRGEDNPIASNLTPEGRALNRRVEVVIRPTA